MWTERKPLFEPNKQGCKNRFSKKTFAGCGSRRGRARQNLIISQYLLNELGPVFDIKLLKHRRELFFYRHFADEQLLGYLGVGLSLNEQDGYFFLAFRKWGHVQLGLRFPRQKLLKAEPLDRFSQIVFQPVPSRIERNGMSRGDAVEVVMDGFGNVAAEPSVNLIKERQRGRRACDKSAGEHQGNKVQPCGGPQRPVFKVQHVNGVNKDPG